MDGNVSQIVSVAMSCIRENITVSVNGKPVNISILRKGRDVFFLFTVAGPISQRMMTGAILEANRLNREMSGLLCVFIDGFTRNVMAELRSPLKSNNVKNAATMLIDFTIKAAELMEGYSLDNQ